MIVNVYDWAAMNARERETLLRRTEDDISAILPSIQKIIDDVRINGDEALHRFNREFGGGTRADGALCVPAADFDRATARLDTKVKAAIDLAHANIRRFHELQMAPGTWSTELSPGVIAGEKLTPIASVGLYVPRGKGAFPSVMLMLATPAVIAKVPRIVVVTPPAEDGTIDDATLHAARVVGINEVYAVGGAQAIAALAFGTASVPRVAKITGPGSRYVSAAKRLLYGRVDVGLPAGPSESIILCDEHADARLAATDLLIEAEHGPDSAALLVTHSAALAENVKGILPALVAALPEPRRGFCTTVFSKHGGIVLTRSLAESLAFVNDYAPEHLEVLVENPLEQLPKIVNAGEILLGPHAPISLGNYTLGVNAILPTGGFAKSFSCTTVHDFLKRSSFAHVTREGFERLGEATATFAEFEGFPAHLNAIRVRGIRS